MIIKLNEPLRKLPLSEGINGSVFLSAMPGRFDPLPAFIENAAFAHITCIICLAEPDEIVQKAPEYADARMRGTLPFKLLDYPVRDYGIPADADRFRAFIENIADGLRNGENIVMHCAAGIGRTGMAAQHLLMALGIERSEAARRVKLAGSLPETAAQRRFLVSKKAKNITSRT